jgi:ribonuclease D
VSYVLVETEAQLADCCGELATQPWVAIDTEFMREKTYYPELCLLQITGAGQIYCIDTLALQDTSALQELLDQRELAKVFHAARQDLEVLHFLCGMPPAPVFDTQIAAALLGYDDQLGYATLVEAITGTVLPKAHQRTDWSRRPLPNDQLEYAADDVRYLRQLYPILVEQLEEKGRLTWALEDNARLTDVALYEIDPDHAYVRVKQGRTLPAKQQRVLRELAAWRERLAKKRNLPRNWIAKDGLLIYLAQTCPTSVEQLEQVRGLSDAMRKQQGESLLAAIDIGLHRDEEPLFDAAGPMTPEQTARRDRLLEHLKARATELEIRPQVLGARREVDAIVRGNDNSLLLQGWRRQVVGEELLELDQG